MLDDLLDVDELAALLKVPPSFVYDKCRRAERNPLPFLRCGKFLRFRRSDVEAWLELRRQGGRPRRPRRIGAAA
jgi:excisionase family DNA binding protein